MLFESVLHRAEAMIGNVLEQALARALVALLLLVGAGFGTAALSTYVNAKYGTQTGQLIMAGGFATLGLLAMLFVSVVGRATIDSGQAATASDDAGTAEGGQSADSPAMRAFGDAERELVTTMLASAAPVAVPGILRTLIRNLPLVLLILIVAFILSRSGANGSGPENSDEQQGETVKAMS